MGNAEYMGSTVLNCKKCRVLTWIDLHKITKMLRLLASVSCLVSVCLSAPQDILPPGLDAAACPNFPFCGPSPADIPDVPGAAAVIAAQQRALAGPAIPTAIVPGLEAHRAAEAKVLLTHIPGFSAHQAAEAQVKLQQAQVANAFTGLVGASGNIGPSGLCGPSGCVAF